MTSVPWLAEAPRPLARFWRDGGLVRIDERFVAYVHCPLARERVTIVVAAVIDTGLRHGAKLLDLNCASP